MNGRPHNQRILRDLSEIRKELNSEIERIQLEEWDWAPGPEMKTFRALLLEIGAMEKICVHWVATGKTLDWGEIQTSLAWEGTDPKAAIASLAGVRQATNEYLEAATEEQLQTPVAVPSQWQQYWGKEIEPEETCRWVCRHESYHLGQLITYHWMRGDNPMKR